MGRSLRGQDVPEGLFLTFAERPELDITKNDQVAEAFAEHRPDIVINAAAFTDVDGAENNAQAAFAVNRDGPAALAGACRSSGAALIHLSTDFVFDGKAGRPYKEDDVISPLSVYGKSKAEGEAVIAEIIERHVIIRTSLVFSPYRNNFVKSILEQARNKDELRVVDDQVGSPTPASDMADALLIVAAAVSGGKNEWGVFHYCGEPPLSRHDFAAAIIEAAGPNVDNSPRLLPAVSGDFPDAAARPAYSVLDCGRINRVFGIEQPGWRSALPAVVDRCLREGT
ncbi:MAG: dTDP-4-dehydrorhamnose reductase [Rhodospirillales bacterium]